ncbi:hypothetical protein D3C87_1954630 [compost metagenome]
MVADGAHFADRGGKTEIAVNHHAVLNIGAATDADWIIIAAQRRAEPDADILGKYHRANDIRIGCNPVAIRGRGLRHPICEAIKRHVGSLPLDYAPIAIRRP